MQKIARSCPSKRCGLVTSDPDATECYRCKTPLPLMPVLTDEAEGEPAE